MYYNLDTIQTDQNISCKTKLNKVQHIYIYHHLLHADERNNMYVKFMKISKFLKFS